MRPTALLACNLSKTYRRTPLVRRSHVVTHALSDATLALYTGSITCLIGESGSGKSTFARCIAGIENPDTGHVLLMGQDLFRMPAAQFRQQRRRIQLVFQDSAMAFNPRFTLEQIVAEPAAVAGSARAEQRQTALRLLRRVGIPAEWSERRPTQLSGGQRQRVAIARALAAQPAVVVFDESLSGLDPASQDRIIALLREFAASSDVAFLFISHDLRLASKLGDVVAEMHQGQIRI